MTAKPLVRIVDDDDALRTSFELLLQTMGWAVTGYGKAVKKQIQEMTRILLHLPEIPRPDDTADALAMAVAHCHCAGNRLSHLPGVSRQAADRER